MTAVRCFNRRQKRTRCSRITNEACSTRGGADNIFFKKLLTLTLRTEVKKLSVEVNEMLKAAFEQGDPASELARKACELHKSKHKSDCG